MTIGLIAISDLFIKLLMASSTSSLESSSIDVQYVWLYWKCSLLENVKCALYFIVYFSEGSRTVTILQLITWVLLGSCTGM